MNLYDKASLILTPNGFKASKLYSLKPTDGTGDFTFSRTGNATRVNSAGLIEAPRTNLLTYSEDFGNAIWSKTFASVATNVIASPSGTVTADKLIEDTANNQHRLNYTTTSAITTNTFSVYLKKAGRDFAWLRIGGNGAYFDLTNGVSGGVQVGVTASITNAGNDWYRCSVTYASAAANEICRINIANGIEGGSYIGDGTSGIYIWGAQLEPSSTATDYIPTTTSARTTFAGITQNGTDASNVPRLNYPSGGGCPSILLEPSRTNILLNSENINSWLKINSTITSDTSISPFGVQNADTVTATGSGTIEHVVYQNLSFTSGTTYCYSVYAKSNNSNYIQMVFAGNLATLSYANFDLLNGTITASSGLTATITSVGNGWYRCQINATAINTATNSQLIYLINSPTAGRGQTFVANNESVYLWGGQFEAGSYATSYIPTTNASVTRNVDSLTKTAVSELIGQTEGTLFVDFNFVSGVTTGRVGSISDSSLANRLVINIVSTNKIQIIGRYNSTPFFAVTSTLSLVNGRNKVAVGYKSGDSVLYINGVLSDSNTDSFTFNTSVDRAFPFVSEVDSLPTSTINGNSFQLTKTRLINTELAALTTL